MNKLVLILTVLSAFVGSSVLFAQSNVAIVNLDTVAKELGVIEHISKTLKEQESELNGKLKEIQEKLQAQMDEVIEGLGDKPTQEQSLKAKQTHRALETQFQKNRAQATRNIQAAKAKMIGDFREKLKPHALSVAKKRNCTVVLNTVMPPVFAYDDSADITQDLIVAAREAGMAIK